jgi:hypothetical protein
MAGRRASIPIALCAELVANLASKSAILLPDYSPERLLTVGARVGALHINVAPPSIQFDADLWIQVSDIDHNPKKKLTALVCSCGHTAVSLRSLSKLLELNASIADPGTAS